MKTSDLYTECGQGSDFDFLGVRRGGIRGVEMGVAGCDLALRSIALTFLKVASGKIRSRETREEALVVMWGRDGGSGHCTGLDMRSGHMAGLF